MAKGYKTGGRQKGTPNKATQLYRDKLAELGFDPVKEAVDCYRSIPQEALWMDVRYKFLNLITAYSQPRPKEVDIPDPDDENDETYEAMSTEAFINSLPVKLDESSGNTQPSTEA